MPLILAVWCDEYSYKLDCNEMGSIAYSHMAERFIEQLLYSTIILMLQHLIIFEATLYDKPIILLQQSIPVAGDAELGISCSKMTYWCMRQQVLNNFKQLMVK